MSDTDYNKLLGNNITSNYRKCQIGVKYKIDKETKKVAESLDSSKKMECYASRPAFITFKDHKPNCRNNAKCRLINPANNELKLVSKKHLENIIANIASPINVNQWQNTTTVTTKGKSRFIKFDIVEFDPSISEELLNRFISFARSITTISESVINIIYHWRKSLLFNKTSAWLKKGNNSLFDVTMGSHCGAEICELVGLYLLNRLSTVIDKRSVGLYRNDGIAAIISGIIVVLRR